MKILSAKQVYQADQVTIKNQAISSADLMEFAATKCFDQIIDHFPNKKQVFHVFCGIGNNGGDGLVIARKLILSGYNVFTHIVKFREKSSVDFDINFEKLFKINHSPTILQESEEFPNMDQKAVIIDAIFGIGLTRPPEGIAKSIIEKINSLNLTVIAIDFPSGLFSEAAVRHMETVIRANYTLTFQNPKLAFFLPENHPYIGEWYLIDIGLDQDFIQSLATKYETISKKQIKDIYQSRSKFSHKGTFGHGLIIGGSFGKIGAVVLASRAALKIGSGLVTAYIPKCGYEVLQVANPEVMVEVDDEKYLQYFNCKTEANVIGIGIGLGMHIKTTNGLATFLKNNHVPLVIDADAINILAKQKELLELIPKNSVLTPHPKEFERLVGKWKDDYEKLDKLLAFSIRYQCIVILKGAYTAIACQNRIYFNTTGNPGLATAGSGDVLTGIITGLMAQKYTAMHASVLGVYLHGRAADIAVNKRFTVETFLASDCIEFLTEAYKDIQY